MLEIVQIKVLSRAFRSKIILKKYFSFYLLYFRGNNDIYTSKLSYQVSTIAKYRLHTWPANFFLFSVVSGLVPAPTNIIP